MNQRTKRVTSNLPVLVENEQIDKQFGCSSSWWWLECNVENEEYPENISSDISSGEDSDSIQDSLENNYSVTKELWHSLSGDSKVVTRSKPKPREPMVVPFKETVDAPLRKAVEIIRDIHTATDEELRQAFNDIIDAQVIDASIIEAVQTISGKKTASDAELVEVLAEIIEAAMREKGQNIRAEKEASSDLMTALHVISGIKDGSDEELRNSCIKMINAGMMDESLLGVLKTIAGNDENDSVEFLADIFVFIAKARNHEGNSKQVMENLISKINTYTDEEDTSPELTMALRIIAGIQDASDEEFRDSFIKIVDAGLMEDPLLGAIKTIAGVENAQSIDFLADIFIEIARILHREDYTIGTSGEAEYADVTIVAGMRLYNEAIARMVRINEKREKKNVKFESKKSSDEVFERLYSQAGTRRSTSEEQRHDFNAAGEKNKADRRVSSKSNNKVFERLYSQAETRQQSLQRKSSKDSDTLEERHDFDGHPALENKKGGRRETFERLYNTAEAKRVSGKERRMGIEKNLAQKHELPVFKKIPVSRAEDLYRRSVEWYKKTREGMKHDADNMHEKSEYDFSCVSSMIGFLPTILE